MTPIFADTSFYVALMNVHDVHHAQALEFLRAPTGKVITTDYVVVEVGNFMRRPPDRPYFLALIKDLADDENTTILDASRDLRDRGIDVYRQHSDKSWSLTDCISFVVMRDLGMQDALTADRHFEQAGFRALLM